MFKFINYLISWNKVEPVKLSMFVKDALAIRNTILNVHRSYNPFLFILAHVFDLTCCLVIICLSVSVYLSHNITIFVILYMKKTMVLCTRLK